MLKIFNCSEWKQILGISDSRSSGVLCNSKYKTTGHEYFLAITWALAFLG